MSSPSNMTKLLARHVKKNSCLRVAKCSYRVLSHQHNVRLTESSTVNRGLMVSLLFLRCQAILSKGKWRIMSFEHYLTAQELTFKNTAPFVLVENHFHPGYSHFSSQPVTREVRWEKLGARDTYEVKPASGSGPLQIRRTCISCIKRKEASVNF